MHDPWNEDKRPHVIIYLFVIVICAAILLAAFLPPLLGVAPW